MMHRIRIGLLLLIIFVTGLKGFTADSARFDLMILSTCFGGTPYTIGALGPFARYIIASPDNLHLSYFDFHSLERLDLNLGQGNVPALREDSLAKPLTD